MQKAMAWVEKRGTSPTWCSTPTQHRGHGGLVRGPAVPGFLPHRPGSGAPGDRGRLFEESVAFMDELRAALKDHRFAFLYENVEMGAEAAKVSSDALGVQPVFVCPFDFGWVSRPRLWWLSVDWGAGVVAHGMSFLFWATNKWNSKPPRSKESAEQRAAASRSRSHRPFFAHSTSARSEATDDGRPKPRSTRGRTPRDADARWQEGGRQFAPWHYAVEAMLQNSRAFSTSRRSR